MAEATISYEVRNDVAHITLNNPDRLNALSPDMIAELNRRFLEAERDARAVLFTGAGRAFCAGADLADDSSAPDDLLDGGAILETHYNPLMRRIRDLAIPIVCSVRGASVGVGMSLALACDIIVAADNAFFLQAFRRIGLVPDGGAPHLLAKSIGRIRALELMLLGERLPAQTALDWGMITRVVPDAELDQVAQALARNLAEGPTIALGHIRRMAWASSEGLFDEELAREARLQRETVASLDYQEGRNAFLEKRPARFLGR